MKKLSVLAIALAATCMFSGCGKETKQNVQPAEETYKNTESETSEECAAAQEEFSEEVVDTEESIDDEWTDEASELDEEVASVLANVDTDYNSVYWGTSYSIFEDLPGVVVCRRTNMDFLWQLRTCIVMTYGLMEVRLHWTKTEIKLVKPIYMNLILVLVTQQLRL